MIATHTNLAGVAASTLAQLIASGEISSAEVVEQHIARIEAVNPALNALVLPRFDEARAEARAADRIRRSGSALGPLHGVPITIKEALDLKGTPSTAGLASQKQQLADHDAPAVARLRAAGAIVLGKTNVAQLLMAFESDNPIYGRSANPWNLGRTPGGSSGGEAAIIAAGGSPLGLGTDIAGSVRIPAAFSGIAAFKATSGRVPDLGRLSVPIGQQAVPSQIGILGRSVADLALGLGIINAAGSSYAYPAPADPATVTLAGLRVAVYSDDGTFNVAPAVQRALGAAADMLRAQGAQVAEWTPPAAGEALGIFFAIMAADGARGMKRLVAADALVPAMRTLLQRMSSPRPLVRTIEVLLKTMGQTSSTPLLRYIGHHDTDHYWQMVAAQLAYQERFRAALDAAPGGPFDIVLCPAAALPALPHGAGAGAVGTLGAYTLLFNLLGYPAGVVPVTRVQPGEESARVPGRDAVEQAAQAVEQGSAGLPIGVQVVARPWHEHVALAAMAAIEASAMQRADYPHLAQLPR